MGRSIFGYHSQIDIVPSDTFFENACVLAIPPIGDRDTHAVNMGIGRHNTSTYFNGHASQGSLDDTREWLDIDVIDATFNQSNVHFLRHSFFSLNREIIDDLRELLTSRRRARHRVSKLERREGNVWVYRVAPPNVTSVFESQL